MTGTAGDADRDDPIRVGLSRIAEELKTLRDQPAWSMNAAEARAALVGADPAGSPDRRARVRVADHARTVAVEADSGATSTANWWAHATKQTRAAAHRKTRLAVASASEVFEPVRVALAEGRLLVDQAQVIVAAVEALPGDLEDVDQGRVVGDPGRVRRRASTREALRDPGETDPRGGGPGGRRDPRSPAAGEGGREAEAAAIPDGRGRSRAGATAGSRSPPCRARC